MTTEKLNGTVYEVHSFVVALPCGHNDTLTIYMPVHTADKANRITEAVGLTEAGQGRKACFRCLRERGETPPAGTLDVLIADRFEDMAHSVYLFIGTKAHEPIGGTDTLRSPVGTYFSPSQIQQIIDDLMKLRRGQP
jgi:hypothetical protein